MAKVCVLGIGKGFKVHLRDWGWDWGTLAGDVATFHQGKRTAELGFRFIDGLDVPFFGVRVLGRGNSKCAPSFFLVRP